MADSGSAKIAPVDAYDRDRSAVAASSSHRHASVPILYIVFAVTSMLSAYVYSAVIYRQDIVSAADELIHSFPPHLRSAEWNPHNVKTLERIYDEHEHDYMKFVDKVDASFISSSLPLLVLVVSFRSHRACCAC